MKNKIIILGAGLTGLSVAYHLNSPRSRLASAKRVGEAGKDYLILEKEETPGGLCRSVKIDGFTPPLCSGTSELSRIVFTNSTPISNKGAGFTFDYTGHLLHLHKSYTKELVFKLLKENLKKIKRNSAIYFQGRYIPYPFQANLWALPKKIKQECIKEFLETQKRQNPLKRQAKNNFFWDWGLLNYGKGICKYFLFPYNKKIWLHSLKEITTDWVNPFVPQTAKKEIILGAEKRLKKDFGYNVYFYYPKKGGIQSLVDAFAKETKNLYLNCEVKKVEWKKKIVSTNSKKFNYRYLISTIPLPELLECIENLPQEIRKAKEKLSWSSLLCINLGIKKSEIKNQKSKIKNIHWLYFPGKEFIFYRIGFYHNFSQEMVPKVDKYSNYASLYIEVSHHPNELLDIKKIIVRVKEDLLRCKILNKKDEILVVNYLPIPYAYVVYDRNRNSALSMIKNFLEKNNIFILGRYAAWKYSFMEESILDGKKLAELLNDASDC